MTEQEDQALRLENIEKLKVNNDSLIEELKIHVQVTNSTLVGLDVPVGWTELVYRLHESIKEILPKYELHQVKSKFGELRYYVGPVENNANRDAIGALINIASRTSMEVCEICGEPAEYRPDIMSTRCENDYRIFIEMRERRAEYIRNNISAEEWDEEVRNYWNL